MSLRESIHAKLEEMKEKMRICGQRRKGEDIGESIEKERESGRSTRTSQKTGQMQLYSIPMHLTIDSTCTDYESVRKTFQSHVIQFPLFYSVQSLGLSFSFRFTFFFRLLPFQTKLKAYGLLPAIENFLCK